MDALADIKKLMAKNKVVIGTNKVLKGLRSKSLKRVFLSSNCPQRVKDDVLKYAGLSGVEVVSLALPNEDLGTVCKKPFFVSMVGELS